MHYTIRKSGNFTLKLPETLLALLEDGALPPGLNHVEDDQFYLEMDDEGFDEDEIAPFLRCAETDGKMNVMVVDYDDDGAKDVWVYEFGPGHFELTEE